MHDGAGNTGKVEALDPVYILAGKIDYARELLQGNRTTLDSVRDAVEGGFKGAAGAQFAAGGGDASVNFQRLIDSLENLAILVRGSKHSFDDLDEEIKGDLKRVQGSQDGPGNGLISGLA